MLPRPRRGRVLRIHSFAPTWPRACTRVVPGPQPLLGRPPGETPRLRPLRSLHPAGRETPLRVLVCPFTLSPMAILRAPCHSGLFLCQGSKRKKNREIDACSRVDLGLVRRCLTDRLTGDVCNAKNTDANVCYWLLSPYCVPGTVLNTLHTMQHINFTTTLCVATIVILILSVSKLRHREVKSHMKGHSGSRAEPGFLLRFSGTCKAQRQKRSWSKVGL